MKKTFKIILAMLMVLAMLPIEVSAEENNSKGIDTCPLEETIDTNNIINVEFINGELYIDVLTELENLPTTRVNFGKCKSEYKYVTERISRSDLVKMRNNLRTNQNLEAATIGFLVGLGNPIAGAIVGFLAGQTRNNILAAVEDALDNSTKSSFTITSKYRCEEGNLGSRGIVHRFRLVSVTIK